VIISDLRELDIDRERSIAIEKIDSQISDAALAAEKAAAGLPIGESRRRGRPAVDPGTTSE
jgi:hypothetical protein